MWPSEPGFARIDGQCAARKYLPKAVALTDPIASPLQAAAGQLAVLPPLLMVVGSGDNLLGENFEFSRRVAGAGGAVQLEVWENMWHDFEEHSEGCGSGTPLAEATEALSVVGDFLRDGARRGGCKTSAAGSGLACVRWHSQHTTLPPVLDGQCPQEDRPMMAAPCAS